MKCLRSPEASNLLLSAGKKSRQELRGKKIPQYIGKKRNRKGKKSHLESKNTIAEITKYFNHN